MQKTHLILFLLLLPLTVFSQRDNLAEDLPFFREKAGLYQRWLDSTGLGRVLKVDFVQLKDGDDTELELHLLLRCTDPDTAAGIWKRIKQDFERIAEKPLVEGLFRSYIFKMEIPAAQGNIQIYLKDQNGHDIPCFYVGIWDGGGGLVKSKERTDECKAETFEVTFQQSVVQQSVRGRATTVSKTLTASEVYDQICRYFRTTFPQNKYQGTDCSGRYPEVECRKENETKFVITVSDLCREALTGSENSAWCKTLRYWNIDSDCNDMRRERLEFRFEYIPAVNGGFRLKGELAGKFGSAAYKPRQQGWWNMDPDFKVYEKSYTERLLGILQPLLARK